MSPRCASAARTRRSCSATCTSTARAHGATHLCICPCISPERLPSVQDDAAKAEVRERRAHAALMLGYLHLDGEGTRRDNGAAVAHMRAAAALGNTEAQSTLGSLYNSGQFGK
jgi:hypothetical protein